jgi:hypothetical protein
MKSRCSSRMFNGTVYHCCRRNLRRYLMQDVAMSKVEVAGIAVSD